MKKLFWGMALLMAIPLNAQFLFINKTSVTIPATGNPQTIGAGGYSGTREVFYIISDTTWRIDTSQPWLTVLVQLYWSNVEGGVKKQWVTLPYSGSAPDIGAFEYMNTYATGHDTAIVTLICEDPNAGEPRKGAVMVGGASTPIRTLIATQTGLLPEKPAYLFSSIDINSPSSLEITYNHTLANIIPDASAFTVKANSITKNIAAVGISGTKVVLFLTTPIVKTDIVELTYFSPTLNPLQSLYGILADSIITPQNVKIQVVKTLENNTQMIKNSNNIITIKN